MPTNTGDLNARITADTSDFKQGMQEAVDSTGEFSKSTEQSAQTTERSMLKIGAAVAGATLLLSKLVAEARKSLAAYEDNSQAEVRLRSAVEATGRAYQMSAGSIMDYTSELQSLTRYAGAETQGAIATLLTQVQDLDEQGIRQIIPLIQDFSTAMGVDLDRAALMVGRTIGTSTNALSRYGIEISDTEDSTQRLAEVVGQLDSRFGGLAQEMATSGAGAFIRLNNELDDLRANAGSVIAEFMNPLILRFADLASSVNASYDATRAFQRALSGEAASWEIEQQIENIRQKIEESSGHADFFANRLDSNFLGLESAGQVVDSMTQDYLEQLGILEQQLATVREREQKERDVAEELRRQREEAQRALDEERALTALTEEEEQRRLEIRRTYSDRYARITLDTLDYIEREREQALEQAKMQEVDTAEEIALINQYYNELRHREWQRQADEQTNQEDRLQGELLSIRQRYLDQTAQVELDTLDHIEYQRQQALEQAILDHEDGAEAIAAINAYYNALRDREEDAQEQRRLDRITREEQREQDRLDREEQRRLSNMEREEQAEQDRLDRQFSTLQTALMTQDQLHERSMQERRSQLDELALAGYDITAEHYDRLEQLNQDHLDRIEQQEKDALQRKIDDYARATMRIAGDITSIWSNLTQRTLNLEEQQALNHAQSEEEKAEITERYAKKQFDANKKTAIANTIMATANAAMEAYKVGAGIGGPILGGTFAAAALAAGSAQVANIRSQQWSGGGSVSPSPSASDGGGQQATQTLIVQGDFDSGTLFSGSAVRDLMDKIAEAQRDGYRVVMT